MKIHAPISAPRSPRFVPANGNKNIISDSDFPDLDDKRYKKKPAVRRLFTTGKITPLLTFAAWDRIIPHHVAVLEDAGDGLRAVGLNKSLLAQEGDGTAQLKVLAEALPIHRYTWVRTLIVTECYGEKKERGDETSAV